MARIPDSEIERLKVEVSVEHLVEASGIALKKTGKDLAGKCPFHEDDTASLLVTPAKNLWHCFGCGAAGGPIDWVSCPTVHQASTTLEYGFFIKKHPPNESLS